jgi:NADPH:quinone reductase-like Zn-dependent oxidoreductase
MKAIILRELGSPEKFEEVDLPIRPPKSDEVLVQIKAGSINPLDCKMREAGSKRPFPSFWDMIVRGWLRRSGTVYTG